MFTATTVTCPICGAQQPMDAVGSVNADRRPDLPDDIISGQFQRQACGTCATTFRLDPRFTYLDIARGKWIVVFPCTETADWPAACAKAEDMFAAAYGTAAEPIAREIGETLNWCVSFGWAAVREKILIRDHDLDGAILELAKLAIIRGGGGNELDSGVGCGSSPWTSATWSLPRSTPRPKR